MESNRWVQILVLPLHYLLHLGQVKLFRGLLCKLNEVVKLKIRPGTQLENMMVVVCQDARDTAVNKTQFLPL